MTTGALSLALIQLRRAIMAERGRTANLVFCLINDDGTQVTVCNYSNDAVYSLLLFVNDEEVALDRRVLRPSEITSGDPSAHADATNTQIIFADPRGTEWRRRPGALPIPIRRLT